jgi:hypothetical protein
MAVESVSSSATAVTLSAATARTGLIVSNDDANRLYVLLDGGTASATNYSFSLAQNENAFIPHYSGPIKGIWASAGSGSARVTSF